MLSMENIENRYLVGDCKDILKEIPEGTFQLIITSPPYADARKNTYGGIHPDEYVDWFLPRSQEFLLVLKPSGTFILNIKERVVETQRHTYVIDLIKALMAQGWLWTEEFIWHKKNSYPGKWPNRLRDSWERCLQFNKQKEFDMYQEAVMVPVGDWTKDRLARLTERDKRRCKSAVGSNFATNMAHWIGRDMVYPSNVLHLSTECRNKGHSAVFPVRLPLWFIKLFTKVDDIVLDPFAGSGTTAISCRKLHRKYLMIDIVSEFKESFERRLEQNEKFPTNAAFP